MKILKLQFKNINNLKGEHEIAFDKIPLDDAGIFAITGPTGSGKSTILDVVTLALFNEVPRYGKISTKGISDLGSILTHHTKDAFAIINYETKGVKYTSEWRIKFAKTGKLRDYEMHLYDGNGKPISDKKSEVPTLNAEIIGLEYNQFIKSIILSQGQFAKFLKANKNERGALLENITGTSIYRKIGKATYEKTKTIKEQLKQEISKIELIQTLSDQERDQINAELNTLKENGLTLNKEIKLLSEIKHAKQEIHNATSTLNDLKDRYNNTLAELANFESEKKKLEINEKLAPIKGDFALYQNHSIKVKETISEIEKTKQKLVIAKNGLTDAISKMAILTNENVDKNNFKSVMSTFEKKVNDLTSKLSHEKEKGREKRNAINDKIVKHKIEISNKAKPIDAISFLSSQMPALDKLINAVKINTNSDQSTLRKKLKELSEELSLLTDLNVEYVKYTELEKSYKQVEEKISVSQNAIAVNNPILEKSKRLVEGLGEKLELLNQQKVDAQLILSLTEHRHNLKNGQPCPLCGALAHPYAKKNVIKTDDEIEIKIGNVKTQYEQESAEVVKLTNIVVAAKASLKVQEEQLKSVRDDLMTKEKETDVKRNSYNGKLNIEKSKINHSIDIAKSNVQQFENAMSAFEKKIVFDDLLKEFTQLKNISENYNSIASQKNVMYGGEDVTNDCNVLQDLFESSKTKITQYEERLNADKRGVETLNLKLASLSKSIEEKLMDIDGVTLNNISDVILEDSILNNLKIRAEKLSLEKTSLFAKIESEQTRLANLQSKDKFPNKKMNDVVLELNSKEIAQKEYANREGELSNKLSRDIHDRKRIKVQEEEIKKINIELEKWSSLDALIGDATGNKYANFAQGLTLQNLLVFANRRLEKLTDRYLLDKPTGEGSLMIIDQYQGNIQRSVNTLSGGESFLVSLALALSLSDMASKNVPLESLFIDEGFGTLDGETLDLAMSTLEKLQSESQKKVGVISHVEALKDRIAVQIKLEKNSQGYSKIVID